MWCCEGVGVLGVLLEAIVGVVSTLGYGGVFIMTFLEGTFFPIPSEITLVPAGYLVSQGVFRFEVVLLCSILGTVGGALFSYLIAYRYGRRIILKYGKYFFLNERKLLHIEQFFKEHGEFSTFMGRIAPGIKHFISFPAGLAKMDIRKFSLYSTLGGTLWVTIVIVAGIVIGDNATEIHSNMRIITICILAGIALSIAIYVCKHNNKRNKINK